MEEFENYIVEKKIGEGAQGVVYLAKHKTIRRSVAIKSLHPELVLNTNHKERFIEEARTLGSLNHSSIVTLYEYIASNNGYHLIMEYLKGKPLDSYIKEDSGPIQESRAIDIFIQVLEGIEYIHQNNIVHRDIKPSNIIIDSKDKIKLLDFGIAKNNQDNPNLTIVGNGVGGTPMYMSPEHVSNQPITIKSDIYSLGVTLWQMLTGVAPYEGMTIGKIYTKIEAASLKDIQSVYAHVSLKMNEIVKKATKKNPNDRFDSCGSFIIALKELKEHLSSKSSEPIIEKKNIEVNLKEVTTALIRINSQEINGRGIIYSAIPGEEVLITIQKKGYKKCYECFTKKSSKPVCQKCRNFIKSTVFNVYQLLPTEIIKMDCFYFLLKLRHPFFCFRYSKKETHIFSDRLHTYHHLYFLWLPDFLYAKYPDRQG